MFDESFIGGVLKRHPDRRGAWPGEHMLTDVTAAVPRRATRVLARRGARGYRATYQRGYQRNERERAETDGLMPQANVFQDSPTTRAHTAAT
jgi:hypothetical protein